MKTQSMGRTTFWQSLADIWQYRHLCFHLAGSDIESRFRRSILGPVWAMIHPLAFTVLYSIVLATLFKQEFKDYSVYVFSGFVLWNAISAFLNSGANSLINAGGYLKQAPIPMLIFPIRASLTTIFIFMIEFASFSLFALVMFFVFGSSIVVSARWFWAVPVGVALILFGIPWAAMIGVLNAKFRDTQQLLVISTQAIWFASPVFFARDLFNSPVLQVWSTINPVLAFCDAFRNPVLYGRDPDVASWVTIGIWILGSWILALAIYGSSSRKLVMYL